MILPRIVFSTFKDPWKPVHVFEYTNYGTRLHHFLLWRWLVTVDFQSRLLESKKEGDENEHKRKNA